MIRSQPGGSEISRKTSGSSFRGNNVDAGMAGQGEKTGTFGRFLLGVVGRGVEGSVVVIVSKRREPKSRLKIKSRVEGKGGGSRV